MPFHNYHFVMNQLIDFIGDLFYVEKKKYFADCKRKLRQGGHETKGTKAIIVLLSKMLSFTEAEINILKEAIGEN